MAYNPNARDPDNCPICRAELHSNNTKRIGHSVVCSSCYNELWEKWFDFGDGLVTATIMAREKKHETKFTWHEVVS